MRPLIAMLLSVALFAGVYGYLKFADNVRRPPLEIKPRYSTGTYSVRIDRTFACVGDSDWGDVKSFIVKFRGIELIGRSDTVRSNEVIEINPLEDVEQLENEIYVFANVHNNESFGNQSLESANDDWGDDETTENDAPQAQTSQAMRVVVKGGDQILAEKTFWLEKDAMSIQGSLSFNAPREKMDGNDHDH